MRKCSFKILFFVIMILNYSCSRHDFGEIVTENLTITSKTIFQPSLVLEKMLFANKIQKVSFSSNEYRLITEKSDTIFASVDISANEKSVEMRLDNKEYVVTFDRIAENITVQNNTDNTIITYTELEGET